jgi:hypothetical protein
MTLQGYLDTIKAKTGKTPADFLALSKKKGLTTHAELLNWLKTDFGLGHGHANAIILTIRNATEPKVSKDEKTDKFFAGKKAAWREPYEGLLAKLQKFGDDVKVTPTNSYLSLLRGKNKFGIVAVTGDRLDVGVKLKGVPAAGRLEAAGDWNSMVTHRVKVSSAKELNAELVGWLKQAYKAAA